MFDAIAQLKSAFGGGGRADRLAAESTFVVLDTETTGLHASKGDRIVSFGAVKIKAGVVDYRDTIDQLIDPERDIPPSASRIHGIHPDDVAGQPKIHEVEHRLARFIGDACIAGHNIDFDYGFIKRSIPGSELRSKFRINPVIDTLPLSIALLPEFGDYDLGALCAHFGIEEQARHTALGDSLMTARLLLKLIDQAQTQRCARIGDLLKLTRNARHIRRLLSRNAHY